MRVQDSRRLTRRRSKKMWGHEEDFEKITR
jgi:hypothetical protein